MENPKKLILRKFAEIQTLSGWKTEFILFAVPEPVGHTRPNERGIHTGTEIRGKIYRRHEILSV